LDGKSVRNQPEERRAVRGGGAKFATSFSRRGLAGEYGMTWLLPRMIGTERAMDLLISGSAIWTLGRRYADPAARQAAWADLPAPFAAAIAKLTRDEIAVRLGETVIVAPR